VGAIDGARCSGTPRESLASSPAGAVDPLGSPAELRDAVGTSSSKVTRGDVGDEMVEFRRELRCGEPSPPYSIVLEKPRVPHGIGGSRHPSGHPGISLS